MSNCVCTKCGAEADSKCPACRTVFMDDQTEAMYSWLLKFNLEKDAEKGNWLKVSLYVADSEDEAKELEHLKDVLSRLNLKQYACIHQWTMKPGCHSTIGCGHY
jgi:hypothetical protein